LYTLPARDAVSKEVTMTTNEWSEASLPDLTGRTVVVTGGNSGIGLEAAVVFARKGAHTIIACRDPGRAEGALAEIRARAAGANVTAMRLDLADLSSVARFAEELQAYIPKLDVLVNNGGIMGVPHTKTKDGFESHLGTNHMGHFALTLRLLPLLEAADAPRVVTVSSVTHKYGKLDFDDLDGDKRYKSSDAYATSKLANVLFTNELERRLRLAQRKTKSIACHPGMAATQITQGTTLSQRAPFLAKVLVWGNALVAQPASNGAWPTLHAALVDVPGGSYVGPIRVFGTRGAPGVVPSHALARDEKAAQRLWEISEARTAVRFPF
jgi:NAD(P)-dependent dehydrogenase (short-subunit alcohol dehydrogenase family)